MVNAGLDKGLSPGEISFGAWEEARTGVTEYLETKRKYLGQMDLNIQSPAVWEFYRHTLQTLAGYGARIVRLDAFAYAPKAPGRHNFLKRTGNLGSAG